MMTIKNSFGNALVTFIVAATVLIAFALVLNHNQVIANTGHTTRESSVDMTHPKMRDYRLVFRPTDHGKVMAIAIHSTTPDGVVKDVLEASTDIEVMEAAKYHFVLVSVGDTSQEALENVVEGIVSSPVLQTTH